MDNLIEPNTRTIYEADPRAPAPLSTAPLSPAPVSPAPVSPAPAPEVYGYGLPAHTRGAGLSSVDIAAYVVAIVMVCGPLLSGVMRAG